MPREKRSRFCISLSLAQLSVSGTPYSFAGSGLSISLPLTRPLPMRCPRFFPGLHLGPWLCGAPSSFAVSVVGGVNLDTAFPTASALWWAKNSSPAAFPCEISSTQELEFLSRRDSTFAAVRFQPVIVVAIIALRARRLLGSSRPSRRNNALIAVQ